MYDLAIAWEWIEFTVRWIHVITAIAWIGSSFYFIALDLGLRKDSKLPNGVTGEEWQVHGGGFYHIQKYMVAPPQLPEHLTWFKWKVTQPGLQDLRFWQYFIMPMLKYTLLIRQY